MHISPTAQQLQNRKSGDNVAIICSVIGLQKGLDAQVDIKWFREEQQKPIVRLERFCISVFQRKRTLFFSEEELVPSHGKKSFSLMIFGVGEGRNNVPSLCLLIYMTNYNIFGQVMVNQVERALVQLVYTAFIWNL